MQELKHRSNGLHAASTDCIRHGVVTLGRAQATEKLFCLPGVPNAPPATVLDCQAPAGNALEAQMLYSFYVHSSRIRFKDFAPGDLFAGTLVPNLTHAGARPYQAEAWNAYMQCDLASIACTSRPHHLRILHESLCHGDKLSL